MAGSTESAEFCSFVRMVKTSRKVTKLKLVSLMQITEIGVSQYPFNHLKNKKNATVYQKASS